MNSRQTWLLWRQSLQMWESIFLEIPPLPSIRLVMREWEQRARAIHAPIEATKNAPLFGRTYEHRDYTHAPRDDEIVRQYLQEERTTLCAILKHYKFSNVTELVDASPQDLVRAASTSGTVQRDSYTFWRTVAIHRLVCLGHLPYLLRTHDAYNTLSYARLQWAAWIETRVPTALQLPQSLRLTQVDTQRTLEMANVLLDNQHTSIPDFLRATLFRASLHRVREILGIVRAKRSQLREEERVSEHHTENESEEALLLRCLQTRMRMYMREMWPVLLRIYTRDKLRRDARPNTMRGRAQAPWHRIKEKEVQTKAELREVLAPILEWTHVPSNVPYGLVELTMLRARAVECEALLQRDWLERSVQEMFERAFAPLFENEEDTETLYEDCLNRVIRYAPLASAYNDNMHPSAVMPSSSLIDVEGTFTAQKFYDRVTPHRLHADERRRHDWWIEQLLAISLPETTRSLRDYLQTEAAVPVHHIQQVYREANALLDETRANAVLPRDPLPALRVPPSSAGVHGVEEPAGRTSPATMDALVFGGDTRPSEP